MSFKPGDIVQLLSGGPSMTVASVPEPGVLFSFVVTDWFGSHGELQRGYFVPEALRLSGETTTAAAFKERLLKRLGQYRRRLVEETGVRSERDGIRLEVVEYLFSLVASLPCPR